MINWLTYILVLMYGLFTFPNVANAQSIENKSQHHASSYTTKWLHVYKTVFSANDVPGVCRFHPSCSVFSAQAFKKFTFFKALWITTDRIMRCNGKQHHGRYPLDGVHLLFEDPIENYE